MSNNSILKALDRMGYKGRKTGHGFRGLAPTILHERGYNHEDIELQLAHTPRNAVSAAYRAVQKSSPTANATIVWQTVNLWDAGTVGSCEAQDYPSSLSALRANTPSL